MLAERATKLFRSRKLGSCCVGWVHHARAHVSEARRFRAGPRLDPTLHNLSRRLLVSTRDMDDVEQEAVQTALAR